MSRPTRRQFVKRLAGSATGMMLLGGELAAGQPATRRPVMIGGQRVRTIDVHAHCNVDGVAELLKNTPLARNGGGGGGGRYDTLQGLGAERIRAMDATGIDTQVLSVNPFWYGAERALASDLIAFQNERLAAMCARQSDRFVGLATVSLQFPELAAEQLEAGIRKNGLRGGSIGGSVNGEELADPKFDPFWAKAQELDAVIFIHPQGIPELAKRTRGNGVLGNVIGNPLETTIALSHLIFEGTLDRFPRLKLCAAHGGGYLPSYANRSDHGCLVFPEQCTKRLEKKPTEYLKQIYFDSLIFTPEALRHLVAETGFGQVVIGTDYPFAWVDSPVDHVMQTPGLNDGQRAAILGGTASRLLKLT